MNTHHRSHCDTPVCVCGVCVCVWVGGWVGEGDNLLAVMVSTREWLETRFLT